MATDCQYDDEYIRRSVSDGTQRKQNKPGVDVAADRLRVDADLGVEEEEDEDEDDEDAEDEEEDDDEGTGVTVSEEEEEDVVVLFTVLLSGFAGERAVK